MTLWYGTFSAPSDINTGGVVHRLHAALVDALDVYLLVVRGEAC